jgi:excisionase family DNA binding protein
MSNDPTMGLTSSEAARELRVSTETLLRWAVKEKKIPFIRLGARKIIFSRKEIEQLLSRNQPPTGGSNA